jgi:hypothetical protein
MASKMRKKSYKKKKTRKQCRMRGGSGLAPLNPALITTSNHFPSIPLKNPSLTLARSIPFIPPRPGSPSPPPPLGMTSGPAFGLKIGAPPLLMQGGGKNNGCGCWNGGKKSRRKKHKKRSTKRC